MVAAVGLQRLDFVITDRTEGGARLYHHDPLSAAQIQIVRACVLHALGLAPLTKHLYNRKFKALAALASAIRV